MFASTCRPGAGPVTSNTLIFPARKSATRTSGNWRERRMNVVCETPCTDDLPPKSWREKRTLDGGPSGLIAGGGSSSGANLTNQASTARRSGMTPERASSGNCAPTNRYIRSTTAGHSIFGINDGSANTWQVEQNRRMSLSVMLFLDGVPESACSPLRSGAGSASSADCLRISQPASAAVTTPAVTNTGSFDLRRLRLGIIDSYIVRLIAPDPRLRRAIKSMVKTRDCEWD